MKMRLIDEDVLVRESLKILTWLMEQQEKSYATMMMYEVAYLVDDLLEIVKGGGVDGN